MADPSFDVVSKVDRQEVDNALNQAAKELSQRFDFRGTGTSIAWAGEEAMTIQSETEERAKAALDVFREKLVKRQIPEGVRGGRAHAVRQDLQDQRQDPAGHRGDKAKEISKTIRDEKLKGVQAQIQGDQLRVTGKKKDDLQAVIALLKGKDFGIALQFTNYR